MSFVMFATGPTAGSRVRTVSMAPLLAGTAVLAALLLGAGGALGYWIATAATATALPIAQVPHVERAAHPALPFTLEQLGAISGRLFRLESMAAQLSKRIGVLQKEPPAASAQDPATTRPAAAKALASGGPMLPARPTPVDFEALDAYLAKVESQIGLVSDAASERNLDVMRMPSRLPVRGAELASPFGNRSDPFTQHHAFHGGLDFAAQQGTPILSAAGGKVSFAGFRSDYGWMVEIAHGNGLATRYAHASRLLVQQGAIVAPGERIALVGSTGRSTGAHLHFEVLRAGGQVDPKRYLAGL